MPDKNNRQFWTPGRRYRTLRWVLVQLRRASTRWAINFDNAVESSAKDMRDAR